MGAKAMARTALRKVWTIFRDAVTGRFVSRAYAALHKETTVGERRKK